MRVNFVYLREHIRRVGEVVTATSTKGIVRKKYRGLFCSADNLLLGRNTSEKLVVIPHPDIRLFDYDGLVFDYGENLDYEGNKNDLLNIYTTSGETQEFQNLDLKKLMKIINKLN